MNAFGWTCSTLTSGYLIDDGNLMSDVKQRVNLTVERVVKIGILGGGNVGQKLAALAEKAGYEVVVGRRNGPVTFQDAAADGEVVILAVHYAVAEEVLAPLSGVLKQKILIDATNPLNDDWSPLVLDNGISAAEAVAGMVPDTIVVKAFNTIFADVMEHAEQGWDGNPVTAFVASDSPDAVKTVAQIASDMGFAPITMTKLSAARHLEGVAHLNIELALGQGGGTNAAFFYHRR